MKTLKIAFYKATYGDWLDKTIAFFSNGPYSHVEMIFENNLSFSSSPRKNGIDFRTAEFKDSGETSKANSEITFITERWTFIDVTVNDTQYNTIWDFCEEQVGKKYDWFGAVYSVLPIIPGSSNRWYCSEVIIASFHTANLWLPINEEITPVELYYDIK